MMKNNNIIFHFILSFGCFVIIKADISRNVISDSQAKIDGEYFEKFSHGNSHGDENNLYEYSASLDNGDSSKPSGVKKRDGITIEAPEALALPIPEETKLHAEQFKRNLTECLKEIEKGEKRISQRLSPRPESPIHSNCLVACVLKKNGVLVKGNIHKDNLLELFGKFYGEDVVLLRRLEKNIDKCLKSLYKYKDECIMAAHLNDCTNDIMASVPIQ